MKTLDEKLSGMLIEVDSVDLEIDTESVELSSFSWDGNGGPDYEVEVDSVSLENIDGESVYEYYLIKKSDAHELSKLNEYSDIDEFLATLSTDKLMLTVFERMNKMSKEGGEV